MDEVVRCSFSLHSLLEKIVQGDFVDHEAHIGGAIFGCMYVLCELKLSFESASLLISYASKRKSCE